ncbi:MAG: hypothetical protein WCP07_04350 [bacterium]|jgi:hypothetical protein
MPVKYKQGDRVTVIARDQTAADIKSGMYYPHYAHLTGTVLKVYGEEASVLVDRETLPRDILKRHEESESSERKKYLDRLSEEARRGAAEREKNFALNYAILTSINDLKAAATTPADKSAADEARRATARDLDAAEEAYLNSKKNGA